MPGKHAAGRRRYGAWLDGDMVDRWLRVHPGGTGTAALARLMRVEIDRLEAEMAKNGPERIPETGAIAPPARKGPATGPDHAAR